MTVTLRKWRALFGIYFQESLAYRASGLIWVMTDVTTAVTMPLVWSAAARTGAIAGFSGPDFVRYYLAYLLVNSFVLSHIMWEVATEIKEGQFSTALVRPIGFFQVLFFRNLSWRVMRTAIFAPIFVGLTLAYGPMLGQGRFVVGPEFWVSLVLGHLVSFTVVSAMSMLALFTQEAMALFELYYLPMLFLSGQLFPVSVLPPWAANLAKVLPFYYTSGAPTEILIGRLSGAAAWQAVGIQALYVVAATFFGQLFWRQGLKHYTGVGM